MANLTRDELLASVFGDMYVSANDPIAKIKSEGSLLKETGYDRIKKRVRDYCTKHEGHESDMMADWLDEGKKIAICTVANDFAQQLSLNLRKNIIPYVAFKRFRSSMFVIRDCDLKRFRRAFDNVVFSACSILSHIFNYEEFENAALANDEDVIYIKNLSEVQMELIRREIYERGGPVKYAMFRMSDDTWGLGFRAVNLLDEPSLRRDEISLLEVVLFSEMALKGETSEYVTNAVRQDVKVERACVDDFGTALQEHPQIIIFDPGSASSALKITEGGLELLDVLNDNGSFNVKKNAVMGFGDKLFKRALRRLLIKLRHFKVVYSERELIAAFREWEEAEKKPAEKNEKLLEGMRFLASAITAHFALVNERQDWFRDTALCETMTREYIAEAKEVLESLAEGHISAEYSRSETGRLVDAATMSGLDAHQIADITKGIDGLSMGELTKRSDTSRESLKDILNKDLSEGQLKIAARNLIRDSQVERG